MRVRDVAAQLPFVSEQFVGKRLATMHADGLVVRGYDRRGRRTGSADSARLWPPCSARCRTGPVPT
ncbi:hypothetical protein [Streptomyces sp. DT171]|uniref:hypothetical protein n=1 Tax=Streptomyces sp. DT171 TaxID=3416524 RepID=UPI003CE9A712